MEKEAFKTFCKSAKVKDIQEYEQKINGAGDASSSLLDKKCELEQVIQKHQNQIQIMESHLINRQIDALNQSLKEEEEKLHSLSNGSNEAPLGSLIESAHSISKKQEELIEL